MDTPPRWYQSLVWNDALTVAAVRARRDMIPARSGVYVFSKAPFNGPGSGVLYVGKATNLNQRLLSYLGLPEQTHVFSRSGTGAISSSLRHAGKVQILMEVMHGEGNNVWLSWSCFAKPELLEGALIDWLKPAYNSKSEAILIGKNDPLPQG